MTDTRRRALLKVVASGMAGLTASKVCAEAAAPSERVSVAVVGMGGMGTSHLKELSVRSDVRVAYVCDVDQERLAAAVRAANEASGHMPEAVGDVRTILDDRAVDALFIATPDHWHVPAALLAMDAGKHVYVEKPCSHNVREGRLLVDAVHRTGRTLQVGTQSRSAPFLREAIEMLHSGAIGEVLVAKAWNSQRRTSIGKSIASSPPPHLDYDAWLGPAPDTPFRENLLHSTWRWWYDFGTGDMGNDGVHDIDVALWGLGVTSHPTRVACFGNKSYFDDDQQFPDTQYAVCEYPLPGVPVGRTIKLIYEQRIWSPYRQEDYSSGAAFYGTEGMLLVGHVQGWRLYGPGNELLAEKTGRPRLLEHHSDFFEQLRRGSQETAADVHAGHRAATVCHLANIAARVGRVVNFNPATEAVTEDLDASRMLSRTYRDDHWATPKDAI